MRSSDENYRRKALGAISDMLQLGADPFSLMEIKIAVAGKGVRLQESWIKSVIRILLFERYLEKAQTSEGQPGYVSIRSVPPLGKDKEFDGRLLHPGREAAEWDVYAGETGGQDDSDGSGGENVVPDGVGEVSGTVEQEHSSQDPGASGELEMSVVIISKMGEVIDSMGGLSRTITNLEENISCYREDIRSFREELALQRRENRALTEEVRTAFDSFMEIIGEFKKWMEGEITALFDLFRKKDRNARDRLRRREAVQEESPQMELIDGDPNANG